MELRWSCRVKGEGVTRSIAAEQARLNFCHLATATRRGSLPAPGKRSARHRQENSPRAARAQAECSLRTIAPGGQRSLTGAHIFDTFGAQLSPDGATQDSQS